MPTPTFAVGTTYTTTLACSSTTRLVYTVLKRTAKFITIEDHHGEVRRVGVKTDDQGEWALPDGNYSMAPTIRAARDYVTEFPIGSRAQTVDGDSGTVTATDGPRRTIRLDHGTTVTEHYADLGDEAWDVLPGATRTH